MTPSINANLQLIYVSDINISTQFYNEIFRTTPIFTSPRYVAYSSGESTIFAIWTGGETPDPSAKRYNEIGIMLSSNEEVEQLYKCWTENSNIHIAQEISTEVFGRTFLIKDPDGHIIRICRLDK